MIEGRNEAMMERYLIENQKNVFPEFEVSFVRGAGEYVLMDENCSGGFDKHTHLIEIIDVMAWLYSKLT